MRVLKFENYTKNNLKKYLVDYYKNTRLSKSNLLTLSDKDKRVAELAQVYFLASSDNNAAYEFGKLTGSFFDSLDDYKKQNEKYFAEFNAHINADASIKKVFQKRMKQLQKENGVSTYKLAKHLETNQSNVARFLKGELKTLSLSNVRKLLKYLKDNNVNSQF